MGHKQGGFGFIYPPKIHGFLQDGGHVGDDFIISGKHMQDVAHVYFVDEYDVKHAVHEDDWDHIDSADPDRNPSLPLVTCPWEVDPNDPDDPCFINGVYDPTAWSVVISGKVPNPVNANGQSLLDALKFPKFGLEVANSLASDRACCYEIVRDQYHIYDDLNVIGALSLQSLADDPDNDRFLTLGAGYQIEQTKKSDFLTGVNEAMIAELALSVQMNWTEFEAEYAISSHMATDGTATNEQGVQLAVVDITPIRQDTSILIDIDLSVSATELTDVACGLFKQGETTPRKMWSVSNNWPDQMHTLRFRHITSSSSSPAFQSWEIRAGVAYPSLHNYNGQVAYINRTQNMPDVYSHTASSVIWMREIKRNIHI